MYVDGHPNPMPHPRLETIETAWLLTPPRDGPVGTFAKKLEDSLVAQKKKYKYETEMLYDTRQLRHPTG